MPFKDKVVLITGASSGIGAACAQYFAREGALLALVGRNAERFQKVVRKIQEIDIEVKPLVSLADISEDDDVERIISGTIKKSGRLDILINKAGFTIPGSSETTKVTVMRENL